MINKILAVEALLAARIAYTLKTFPKQITAAVAVLLMGGGGAAFAVAALESDTGAVPVREVLETVTPLAVAAQTDALDAYSFTLFRSETTRAGDTAESLLRRLGVADTAAAGFIRGNAAARSALFDRVGRTVAVEVTQDNQLRKLSVRWIPDVDGAFRRLVLERTTRGGFDVRSKADTLSAGTRLASGVVRSSLFAATDDAGIPDAVASQLADVFSGAVDFRQLRRGDKFAVVYETFEADGQALRSGRVLAAEFESNGKLQQAMWFQEPGKKGSYYRPNGDSLRRAYLSSPVEFSRITSGFAMRLHPILNSWRQHNGVDFAAPTGTAVRAIGDGTVTFAGQQNGYGNVVILQHRNAQETVYAHLSRVDVQAGQAVAQSQFIGAVGSTGWATGPHLHFEFRVNGEHADPTTIAQQDGGAMPIAPASRPAFDKLATANRAELAAAFSVQASAD